VADQCAADWAHQIADREYAERGKELRDGVLVWEELTADDRREVSVDCKVVPFEHVADHAGGDDFSCLRGNHVPIPSAAAARRAHSQGLTVACKGWYQRAWRH